MQKSKVGTGPGERPSRRGRETCRGKHAREDVAPRFIGAAFPPRRGLGDAARENSDYLVGGAAKTRTDGKAAGPESGPCIAIP